MAPIATIDVCGTRRILSVLTVLLAPALSAATHHGSNVSYLTDQTMTIAGTVTEWEFSNPHPQIYFDVKTETGEIAKACTATRRSF